MSAITTISDDAATGRRAEIYAEDRAEYGFVPDHTRAMTVNLPAYDAWEALISAVAKPLGKRRYELVTLAAALGIGSKHCRLAHGRNSIEIFGEEQLLRIATDYRNAGLTPSEVAIMAYAEKVSRDSSAIGDADVAVLRDHGLSDDEIANVALAAAARNYYSRAIQALVADAEALPGLSAELASALTDGL